MIEVFDENNYNFTDSILSEIRFGNENVLDYLMVVDYFLGQEGSVPLTLRLKNVQEAKLFINKKRETYLIAYHTLAHISKTKKGELVELKIFSAMVSPEHQNDEPLIYCLCEEVYVEDKKVE